MQKIRDTSSLTEKLYSTYNMQLLKFSKNKVINLDISSSDSALDENSEDNDDSCD